MRGPVSRYLSHWLGREVRINGNLRVNLFSWQPHVDVGGLWIANPQWLGRQPAADVQQLSFKFRLVAAGIWRTLDIAAVVKPWSHPSIDIAREADGRTNWQFTNNPEGADFPPIQRFLLNDGSIRIEDKARHLSFFGKPSPRVRTSAGARRPRSSCSAIFGTLNVIDSSCRHPRRPAHTCQYNAPLYVYRGRAGGADTRGYRWSNNQAVPSWSLLGACDCVREQPRGSLRSHLRGPSGHARLPYRRRIGPRWRAVSPDEFHRHGRTQ